MRAMRDAGHDVVYIGERARDPGDEALLAEAAADRRIFVTKDHDIGALVDRDRIRIARYCSWMIWVMQRRRQA